VKAVNASCALGAVASQDFFTQPTANDTSCLGGAAVNLNASCLDSFGMAVGLKSTVSLQIADAYAKLHAGCMLHEGQVCRASLAFI
jgi:hypothetical protein